MKAFFLRPMELSIGSVRIHLLLPLLLLSSYLGNYFALFLISWTLALLHEGAHLWVGTRLGISFSGISFLPFGVCARLKEPVIKSPGKEILTALAGPLSSLLIGWLFRVLLTPFPSAYLQYAMVSSFSLGILNLLPCLPLDGGRMLRAILTHCSDAITAWKITAYISRVLTGIILCIGIYLLLTSAFQFSLLFIGVFLLGNLASEQKGISHQALRELLYYKEKPAQDSFTRTDFLSASSDFPARKLLRKLSYHKYYCVQVLDHHQRIQKTLTESEILDALLNRSIRITLGEI